MLKRYVCGLHQNLLGRLCLLASCWIFFDTMHLTLWATSTLLRKRWLKVHKDYLCTTIQSTAILIIYRFRISICESPYMQKFICNACIISVVICRCAWAVKTLSPLMHPFPATIEQDKALSGFGSHSETTRGWRQKWTVQSEQKLWLSSQLCHLPVEWPQASHLTSLNQLSLLQNKGNRIH